MIGISSPPLCVMPFRQAAEAVVPHFELWEVVSEACHSLPDIEEEMKDLLDTSDLSMSVHAPFSDINLAAFDAGARKHALDTIRDIVRICNRLDIGPVTLHPGVVGPIQRYDVGRVFRLTREGLEIIGREAEDSAVKLALENMPAMKGTICQTAEDIVSMLEGLDIGICFDIGHANTAGQVRPLLNLEKRFVNMHVHDNMGERDQHLPLGMGNIDFSQLRRLSYGGNHVIEVSNTNMAEATKSMHFLENIIG